MSASRILFSLLVFLLILPAGCVRAPHRVIGKLESGAIRWQGTVLVAGDTVLPAGSTLTIAPGTEVVFLPPKPGPNNRTAHPYFPGGELIVRGSIFAEGTPSAPITFRYVDPKAPAGSWGAVNLQKSPEARFRYCRFTQADSALHSQESHLLVEQCLFENNLVGIRFNATDLLCRHNLLRHNGTAIRFHFGSPVIRGNEICDNDKGFFFTSHPRNYHISDNNIVGSSDWSVVLGEEVPEPVDMRDNFWGSSVAKTVQAGFFDGRHESYLGRVHFRPFARRPFAGAGIAWSR